METITLTIGLVILAVYLAVVIIKDGAIPPSISDTFYTSGKWMFFIVMAVEAVLLTMSLIEASDSNWQWLAFISGAALAFVGSAPHFQESYEHKVHFSAAFTFAIGTQLWVGVCQSPWWLLGWVVFLPLMLIFKSRAIFIGEIGCVTVTALSIYF